MKRRATALFLLMITAIFTIRPVIAMHYCMGELHSFSLYQHHETTHSACCQSAQAEFVLPIHQTFVAQGGDCCDNTLLELTTDEYQNKTEISISRVISNSVADGILLFTHLLKLSVPEIDDPPSSRDFPPEGLFLKDIDILTYICIYRI